MLRLLLVWVLMFRVALWRELLLLLLLLRIAIAHHVIRQSRRLVARDVILHVSGRDIGIRRGIGWGHPVLSLRLWIVLERIILIWGLVLLIGVCLHGVNFIGNFF